MGLTGSVTQTNLCNRPSLCIRNCMEQRFSASHGSTTLIFHPKPTKQTGNKAGFTLLWQSCMSWNCQCLSVLTVHTVTYCFFSRVIWKMLDGQWKCRRGDEAILAHSIVGCLCSHCFGSLWAPYRSCACYYTLSRTAHCVCYICSLSIHTLTRDYINVRRGVSALL